MLDRLQDDAYEGGLKPHEFFELTPGETAKWLGAAWRGAIIRAYYQEGMHRRKRLPSTTADLFPRKDSGKVLEGVDMLNRLKNIAKESQKRDAAAKAPTAKQVRK